MMAGMTEIKPGEGHHQAFYKAAKFGHLEVYKQLMIDFGIKNPEDLIENDELTSALEIAIKYHHSALSRVISKVTKEDTGYFLSDQLNGNSTEFYITLHVLLCNGWSEKE